MSVCAPNTSARICLPLPVEGWFSDHAFVELRLREGLQIYESQGANHFRSEFAYPLTGKPDFVFPRDRLVVFVDGCFWHGCPTHATWPRQNAEFWRTKILGNQRRDRAVNRLLKKAGWTVVRIWEHELTKKNQLRLLKRLRRILAAVTLSRIVRGRG